MFKYNSQPPSAIANNREQYGFEVFPIPSETGSITIIHQLNKPKITLFDSNGKEIGFTVTNYGRQNMTIHIDQYLGVAFLVLCDEKNRVSKTVLFIE